MCRLIACFGVLLIGAFVMAQDGPLTDGANIPVRTDSNGYLLLAAQTYTGPDGPRRPLANTLVRTDANGYLIVTNPDGFGGGAPADAEYWVGAANADLTAEKNLGALSTGLVLNTSGTPSAYGGSSCTNQFVRSLNASGSATCNSVSLTADVTGTLPPGNIYTETTVTTTGNIDDLSFSNANIIRMNNASDATIRGLAAGTDGQLVTIVSVGSGHVRLEHQNANSSEANRLINYATSANTPLAAGVGTATYQYDGTADRWRLVSHEQGAFIDVSYDSNDFSAVSGTWTVESGDLATFAYYLKGRQLTILLVIVTSTLSGSTNNVSVAIPNGYTVAKLNRAPMSWIEAATSGTGMFSLSVGGASVSFFVNPLASVNWQAGTNDHNFYFNSFVAIN